jgi:hypothetical protein
LTNLGHRPREKARSEGRYRTTPGRSFRRYKPAGCNCLCGMLVPEYNTRRIAGFVVRKGSGRECRDTQIQRRASWVSVWNCAMTDSRGG